ncbi:MAG TPA: hypothetical protein VKY73_00740 [Polyangiaceae bacterium]|nr:hypothetical protein [Polyangiaceae bacterium]
MGSPYYIVWVIAIAMCAIPIFNFLRGPRRGGCREAYGQELERLEFGLAPDEIATHRYFGLMYVGPLRPDVDFAVSYGYGYKRVVGGAQCRVALTSHGRLAIAWESTLPFARFRRVLTQTPPDAENHSFRFGPRPRPRIRIGHEVFPPDIVAKERRIAPRLYSYTAGGIFDYELVHIDGPEHEQGFTLWLAPPDVEALRRWAQGAEIPAQRW